MNQKQIIEKYKSLISDYQSKLEVCKKKSRLISLTRLIVFILGAIGFYYLLQTTIVIISVYSLIFIIIFLILVKISLKVNNKITYFKIITDINKNEIDAINFNQKYFYNGEKYIDKTHSFSFDLDIFGKNSIFNLINRTVTQEGEQKFSDWFNNPDFSINEIIERQRIIKEIADKNNFRQRFLTLALQNKTYKTNFNDIKKWINTNENIFSNTVLNILSKVLSLFSLVLLVLVIFSQINFSWFVISFLFNLFFESFFIKKIFKSHSDLSNKIDIFKSYADLLILIENENFSEQYLIDKQNLLKTGSQKASLILKKFYNLNNYLDSSKNLLLGVILNGIFLWDLNFIFELEKYKKQYSQNFINWFNIISEFDALISLSTFVYNFPDYSFPQVIENDKFILKTENIAHPLIKPDNRIANDFEIQKYGEIKIITGANMAGKSTFLRTVGVNIIFAYLGVGVCADSFIVSKVKLFTSMRTSDDLAENTSYFHAELLRLKQLKIELDKGNKMFIILDEILKGTNSADKERGSKAFLEKIINYKLAGIVATHDLALGNLENKYPDNFKNLCFEVNFEDDNVIFDYKLRNGITTKMNAYFLMQKMKLI